MPHRKRKLDPGIKVAIDIPPPTEEVQKLLDTSPRLATLHRLLMLQAMILAQGTEDTSLVQEMGRLYAMHYRDINTRDIPGACDPLYKAFSDLCDDYGQEIACRTFVERTMRMGASFAREFLKDAQSRSAEPPE